MNAQRRKQIESAVAKLDELKASAEEITSLIESIKDEEQAAYDGMPESLKESERGQKSQEAIDNLESAYSDFEDIVSRIDDVKSALQTAAE